MLLRLTVRDSGSGVSRDVELSAGPDSTVAAVLSALQVANRPCFVGATMLDPAATVADSPLVPGAVISVGEPGPGFRAEPGRAAVGVLTVVSGPDTGLTVSLPPGTHLIARNRAAAVCLRDTDVSRSRHAELEVHPDGRATVKDLGSTNGTSINGATTTRTTTLRPGDVIRVGATSLLWTPAPRGVLTTLRSADGRLDFDRSFAAAPAISRAEVALPVRQALPDTSVAPVLGGVVGVLAGIVIAIVSQQWPTLLISVGSLVVAVIVHSVQSGDRKEKEQAFTAAQEAAQRQVDSAVARETEIRHQLSPGPSEIGASIIGARHDLWPRRADAPNGLVLRVGTADQPASVDLRGERPPGLAAPVLRNAPVTVDLRETGVLGVVGTGEPAHASLRWLVIQLCALRGPDDLRVVVLTDDNDRLAWTRWLPHVDPGPSAAIPCRIGNTPASRAERVEELRQLVAARRAERGSSGGVRFADEVVVVCDGALELRKLPGMHEVLRDGPSVGVYSLCADRQGMNECRGLCEITENSLRLTRSPDAHPVSVAADGIDAVTAERLARALAPMRDRLASVASGNAIPDRVRFLDLLRLGVPTGDDVLALWNRERGPATSVVVGADESGPVRVDLARQGPHTMLGGATGAGKSILLQTLVTSLLLENRPDELNLVLVDFKGGSAFLPFERCPHVVALVRSTGETAADVFDEAAAARVLASVRAEVSRRESMLARFDGEIDTYWRHRRAAPELPPLPRLVMIFDEFARVLESSPDFLKELVNVAAKGRSLGMHLVLATQSLQGKLSPELKNNISLRISLRQNEPADSVEVLAVPDAATIPGSLRGRAMIVCTTDGVRTPRTFQSGYLGDPPPSRGSAPVSARAVAWTDLGLPRPVEHTAHDGTATDQDLTIAAIEEAGRRAAVPAPFRPLLPPLPAAVPLGELDRHQTAPPPGQAAPFGLLDLPHEQAQPADFLDLAGTNRVMVAGGPQSGRTTFARTLITSLATRFRPDEVHIYVLEQHPAGLADYASLPHCGGVFSPAEPDRIRRFVTWLDSETQRRTTNADGPRIVFIIDGWEHFEDHSDPNYVETSLPATLRGIIGTGPKAGVHVVALGGQDMLNHKLSTLYDRRLLLPFPKEETRRAHLTSGMASPPRLPGRAIDAATGRHVQICQPDREPDELIAEPRPVAGLPKPFPALPTRITLDEVPVPQPAPSPTWIPLGVGGDDAVGTDLFGTSPHVLLVSGPPGSGRTTAAATVAHALRRVNIGVLALASPRSPLPGLLPNDPGVRVLTDITFKDADLRAAAEAFGDGPYAVVLDDADHVTIQPTQQGFTDTPTLLDDIAHPAARGHRALVFTADAAPLLGGFPSPMTRLVNTAVTTGSRLLLTPANRSTAVAHAVSLEHDQFFTGPAGRGYLISSRKPVLLQLASTV